MSTLINQGKGAKTDALSRLVVELTIDEKKIQTGQEAPLGSELLHFDDPDAKCPHKIQLHTYPRDTCP